MLWLIYKILGYLFHALLAASLRTLTVNIAYTLYSLPQQISGSNPMATFVPTVIALHTSCRLATGAVDDPGSQRSCGAAACRLHTTPPDTRGRTPSWRVSYMANKYVCVRTHTHQCCEIRTSRTLESTQHSAAQLHPTPGPSGISTRPGDPGSAAQATAAAPIWGRCASGGVCSGAPSAVVLRP